TCENGSDQPAALSLDRSSTQKSLSKTRSISCASSGAAGCGNARDRSASLAAKRGAPTPMPIESFMGPEPDAVLASSVAPNRLEGGSRVAAHWLSHQSAQDQVGVREGDLQFSKMR